MKYEINSNLKLCSNKDLFIWVTSCEDPKRFICSCIESLTFESEKCIWLQ